MDTNYESYVDECWVEVQARAIGDVENWSAYDDMLKFSNCWNVNVNNCVVVGGREDCIDMCRGGDYRVQNSSLIIMGKNGITCKCGVEGLRVEGVEFDGYGMFSEIEIGMFSKYDKFPFKNKVQGVIISDVKRKDGKKVRVWVWNGTKPVVRGGNVRVVRVPRIIWVWYFLFRQFCVKYLEK